MRILQFWVRKNVNIYGSGQTRDKVDILKWGIQRGQKSVGEHAKNIMLMSMAENQEGTTNFDKIQANLDAVMVARVALEWRFQAKRYS